MDIVERLREKTKSLEWLQKMGGSDKHVLVIMSDAADEIERLREAAMFLFGLLDDVDTADDVAKGDDKFYRNQIRAIHKRRFEVAETDGYNVKIKTALQQKDSE